MPHSVARVSKRASAARSFALIALAMAGVYTAIIVAWLPSPLGFGVVLLPFLAAACAFGWAWLLYPRNDAEVFGAARGAAVALLSYLSVAALLAASDVRNAGILIAGFVWTPFPWLAIAAGALAGEADLNRQQAPARLMVLLTSVLRVLLGCTALLWGTYRWLDERASSPRAHGVVKAFVSGCQFFAGAALGLVWFPPEPASSEMDLDVGLRLLPAVVALMLAVVGWVCARALLATLPAKYRLGIALMSALLAGAAAIRLASDVL